MALSQVQENNRQVQFRKEVLTEYVRDNTFSDYMGDGVTSIIRIFYDPKDGGDQVNVPLVTALKGKGKSTGSLAGNEENIDDYGFRCWVDWARNAVKTNKREQQMDMGRVFDKAQPLLTDWGKELQRDEIIAALMALPSTSEPVGLGGDEGQRVNGILYEDATATEKDTWNQNNSDRVLYGNTTANYNSTHATALANVDTTNDKMTADSLTLLKYVAKNAKPKIRPFKVSRGREYFVVCVGSLLFRDISKALEDVNVDGRPRDVGKNPVFQDGDLIYRGMIVREIPELDDFVDEVWTSLQTAGNSNARVNPCFVLGQQAVAMPWAQNPKPTRLKEDDYEFNKGVGVEMAYGVAKMFKKHPKTSSILKQWGVVTGFFCASST